VEHTLAATTQPEVVASTTLSTHEQLDPITKIITRSNTDLVPRLLNPYPDISPIKLLQKEYLFAQMTWSAASVSDNIFLPGTFFNLPSLECAMKTFKYWRADFNIHVTMTATPYHQGAMMISWLPCTELAVSSMTRGKFTASGNNAIILNYSTSDSCKFTIPYRSNKAWLKNPPDNPYDHSTIYFHPLVALANPTTVNDYIKMNVYISMSNVTLAGFEEAQSSSESNRREDAPTSSGGTWIKPFINTMELIPDVVEGVSSIASTLAALDKPTQSISPIPVYHNMFRDVFQGRGVDTSQSLSFDQNTKLANVHSLLGALTTSLPFSKLMAQPMLHFQREFTTANMAEEYFPVHPSFPCFGGSPVVHTPDYLYHFAQMARFWRGSIKYFFHFCTNQFVKGRFKIAVVYNSAPVDITGTGDLPSKIVDVAGTTMVELTVPYLWDTLWREVAYSPNSLPRIYVAPVGDFQGATLPTDALITMSVFRAAGSDFQLACQGEIAYYDPPSVHKGLKKKKDKEKDKPILVLVKKEKEKDKPTMTIIMPRKIEKAQCSINERFSKTFDSFIKGVTLSTEVGICQSEVLKSPDWLMKRYAQCHSATLANQQELNDPTREWHPAMYHLGLVFAFWRGSRRVGIISDTLTTPGALSISQPVVATVMNRMPFVEGFSAPCIPRACIPYASTLPFQFSNSYPFIPATASENLLEMCILAPSGGGRYVYAGGDDLIFGYLFAPSYEVAPPDP
jgi:hypothetical protein